MAGLNTRTRRIVMAAGVTVAAASIGTFCVDFLPHTFFLQKHKSIVQMYKLGQPVPVHDNVQKLFDEVCEDMKMHEMVKKQFDVFTVTGFNLYHAGVPSSRFGGIIGIPITFTYMNKNEVNTTDIRIGKNKESLNPYHPAADNLIESLVLSKNAKKFAIGREILMSQKEMPFYRSFESPIVVTTTGFLCEYIRMQMNLYNKIAYSMILYTSAGLLGFSIWFQIRDTLNTYFEKVVDAELAELGPDYVEGGKEFYAKLLKRNVSLRVLMGSQGPKLYNMDGDPLFFIRQKTTPITYRYKYFTELLSQTSDENRPLAA